MKGQHEQRSARGQERGLLTEGWSNPGRARFHRAVPVAADGRRRHPVPSRHLAFRPWSSSESASREASWSAVAQRSGATAFCLGECPSNNQIRPAAQRPQKRPTDLPRRGRSSRSQTVKHEWEPDLLHEGAPAARMNDHYVWMQRGRAGLEDVIKVPRRRGVRSSSKDLGNIPPEFYGWSRAR